MGNNNQPAVTETGPINPWAKQVDERTVGGAVAIEQDRAVAEAQGKLVIAKKFPRDPGTAFTVAMESCRRPTLASAAFFSFPRGDETITGISIRLAEELARVWGNIDFGIRELSQGVGPDSIGFSEMEAYCWDLETNTLSSQKFTVKHYRETRSGGYKLTSQRDIFELCANMGARRLRARILSVLPPDLIEAAEIECRKTLAGEVSENIKDTIKRMVAAFSNDLNVSKDRLESRLGHKVTTCTADEIVTLKGIYTSIRDGQTKVDEWFGHQGTEAAGDDVTSQLNKTAAGKKKAGEAETPADEEQTGGDDNAGGTEEGEDGKGKNLF